MPDFRTFISMKLLLSSIIFLLVITFSISCQKKQEHTLIVQIINGPDNLHPFNNMTSQNNDLNLYTQLNLLRVNYRTGLLEPCLAKALAQKSDNGLNFSYELRDHIVWDDSSPITAYDIAFSFKAYLCFTSEKQNLNLIAQHIDDIIIDKKNNKKFTVKMKHPHMLNEWFWTSLPIIQETFYDKHKLLSRFNCSGIHDTNPTIKQWLSEFTSSENSQNPLFINGAGPYKICEWKKGKSITLIKKKNYWAQYESENESLQSNPDSIILKTHTLPSNALEDLENTSIDISTAIDFESFTKLSKDELFKKKYFLKLADTYNYIYVAMNMKPDGKNHQELFSDVAVRKAMALLTPYEQINKTLFANQGKRAIGPVPIFKHEFNWNLRPIKTNVAQAKAILKEAGWIDSDHDQLLDKVINGKKINLEFNINYLSGYKIGEEISKLISESMRQANIFVMLNPLDYFHFTNATSQHDFDMSISVWQGNAQPEDFSQLWHTKSWANNGLNFTGFGTATSDALIDSMNSCFNENKRINLSKRFQKIVYDNQPYIFLFAQTRRIIIKKKWENSEVYKGYPNVLLNTLRPKQ